MFEKDPRTFAPEYKNLSPEQKAMVKLEISLSRFFKHFDDSVKRWERMIYPAIIVFGLLAHICHPLSYPLVHQWFIFKKSPSGTTRRSFCENGAQWMNLRTPPGCRSMPSAWKIARCCPSGRVALRTCRVCPPGC